MTILTNPSGTKPGTAHQPTQESLPRNGHSALLTLEKIEEGIARHEPLVVEPAPHQATAGEESLLSALARLMLAFYDWLSGPGISERDRVNAMLAYTERERRAIDAGVLMIM